MTNLNDLVPSNSKVVVENIRAILFTELLLGHKKTHIHLYNKGDVTYKKHDYIIFREVDMSRESNVTGRSLLARITYVDCIKDEKYKDFYSKNIYSVEIITSDGI